MNERNIIETQPERTDLPLIVIPVIVESMIEPFAANFPLLHDIARIRMHCDFTLDTDTILERTKDAEAVIVIGFHITDDILDAMTVRGHVSCFAFGGTGVASYINLPVARSVASACATSCITATMPWPSTHSPDHGARPTGRPA